MIIRLKTKCFRRHEDLELTFSNGLNTLRGVNEAGKSTVIEAVLYALYGTKALRDTLAETVTWGHKEKDLEVELVISIRGVMYSFTRSKGGAECRGDDGVVVTGQAEVTSFAADVLGADAKTASVLMLASQSGLRGALDDGPAAVSGLMAKLADFDVIDRILAAANEKLSLGSTAPLAQKIDAAMALIQEIEGDQPDPSILPGLVERHTEIVADVERLTKLEEETYQPAITATNEAVLKAEEWNKRSQDSYDRLNQIKRDIAAEEANSKSALEIIVTNPGDAVISALREDARVELDHAKELALYRKFQGIVYPSDFWEGDLASFEADIVEAKAHLDRCVRETSDLNGQKSALSAQRITSGKCPTCGHAARSDEHVAEHNAKIDAQIVSLTARIQQAQAAGRVAKAGVDARDVVMRNHTRMQQALVEFGDRVVADTAVVPHRPAWVAAVPSDQPSTQAQEKLQKAEKLQRECQQAQGRYDGAMARLQALDMAKANLKLIDPKDVEPLKLAYEEAYAAYAANATLLREAKDEAQRKKRAIEVFESAAKDAQNKLDDARRRVAEYQEDIRKTEFNNILVTKLKKIKPAITDHLWNTVLAAVGTFFSSMRGESSVVTKDQSGFRVNGKSVESLSGSTLDVLALAIRVALTKTFIPHATFVVLDEPAHGCDNERTGNVLGFLSGAGFSQTILASHDELSEAVADNVISL